MELAASRARLRREKASRRAKNSKYTTKMYCKEEVFTDAIDFIDKKVGWHQLPEPITGGS